MAIYSREKFSDDAGDDFTSNFTDSQVWSATVASTGETSLGNIRVPSDEVWVIEQIWAQGTGGEYRLDVGSFKDATCDYNNDPTITHDDDDGDIKAGMKVSGTGIPEGATVSSVTDDTEFELSVSTTGGSVSNGTLTFTDNQAIEDLNGKFVQNADGDAVKNNPPYNVDILIKGETMLTMYVTNNDSASTVCKAMIIYKRYKTSNTCSSS